MSNESWKTSVFFFLALLIPFAEYYLAVSFYYKRPDIYERSDLMVRMFTVGFALFVVLHSITHYVLQRRVLILHLVIWALYLLLLSTPFQHWVGFFWMLILGTALCLFVEPKRLWDQIASHKIVGIFLAIALAFQTLHLLMEKVRWIRTDLWYNLMATPTAGIVHSILSLLGYDMQPTRAPYILKDSSMELAIHMPCSGMEGIMFFVTVFSCMMMLDHKLLTRKQIVLGYLSGIVFMWILNLVRLTVFFAFGVWAIDEWGHERGMEIVFDLFHKNVGWILYTLGIGLYFIIFYRKIGKTQTSD